jgi:hypothetical protein
MTAISDYLDFVSLKGIPLAEINPGSKELALKPEDALRALDILNQVGIPVVGGDVLSLDNDNKLIYAYQLWGSEYHVLNWYSEKAKGETDIEYVKRSNKEAREAIQNAVHAAIRLKKECLIVFII